MIFLSVVLIVAASIVLTIFVSRIYLAKIGNIHSQQLLQHPITEVVEIVKDPVLKVADLIEDLEHVKYEKLERKMRTQYEINKKLLEEIEDSYHFKEKRREQEKLGKDKKP